MLLNGGDGGVFEMLLRANGGLSPVRMLWVKIGYEGIE